MLRTCCGSTRKLWTQFFPGQSPPTTWQQYAADGQALVKSHPGYYIGEFGQPWDAETYLWGNECPINEAVGKQTLLDNPGSPNCTTIAKLIDSALAGVHEGRSVHDGVGQGQDRTAHGHGHRRDLAGNRDLPVGYELRRPRHQRDGGVPAAGGDQRCARDRLDRWRAVDGQLAHHAAEGGRSARRVHGHEPEDPGEPDGHAGPAGVCARPERVAEVAQRRLRQPAATEAAIKKAAAEIWTGWSPVPWSVESIFGNTVTPGLLGGGTFTSALTTLAANIKSAAQSAGWQVKS